MDSNQATLLVLGGAFALALLSSGSSARTSTVSAYGSRSHMKTLSKSQRRVVRARKGR